MVLVANHRPGTTVALGILRGSVTKPIKIVAANR
jgi:hypothetical protein